MSVPWRVPKSFTFVWAVLLLVTLSLHELVVVLSELLLLFLAETDTFSISCCFVKVFCYLS